MNWCWSIFCWGTILAVAAALVVGGCFYLRLDDEIRRHVETVFAKHYPGLEVRVGKARFEQNQGISISELSIGAQNRADGEPPMFVVDELYLVGDVRVQDLLSGNPHLERIVVRRPRIQANRLGEGRWNLMELWPLPKFSDEAPEIRIEDATVTLADRSRVAERPLTLRGIDLTLTPQQTGSAAAEAGKTARRLQVVGTVSGAPAQQITVNGTIGPDDGLLDLTVDVRSLDMSPELVAAIPCRLPSACDGVQLYGNLDATLRLTRAASSESPLSCAMEALLTRGRLESSWLAKPLTDLTVNLRADPNRLFVERLAGKFGTASVALACERSGWLLNSPMSLAGSVEGLTVDHDTCASLPATLQRVWQRFQPAGTVNAQVQLTFDGRQWQPELTAQCRGVSLTDAEKFPYRLGQATGTLKLGRSTTTGNVELGIDLTATGAGRPVQITARYDDLRIPIAGIASVVTPHRPTGWIEIAGSGIPIHEQLLAALPENVESFARSLTPAGNLDFRWRHVRTSPTQSRGDTELELKLTDCAVQYDRFPYPLEQIQGLVTAQNGQWTLHDLTGRDRQGAASITCGGSAVATPGGMDVQLAFHGANLPLDENLRQAVSPRVQTAWAELRPEGRVNFTASVTRRPGQAKPDVEVELRPNQQTVSLTPTFFPYRFDQIDGRAIISADKVDLQQLRARHGRSNFSASGSWQATADGGWQLALSGLNVDWLSLEPDLLTALPPGLKKVVERLRPIGSFDAFGSTLNFVRRGEGTPVAASWDVNIGCHQASLRGELPLENVSGGVRVLGQCDGPSCRSYGELAIDSLVWRDVQLTNVHGPFWTDSEFCLLGQPATEKLAQPPRRVTADLYGGSLTADVFVQHAGQSRFRADISLGGASLNRISSERFRGPDDLTGTVSGKLALEGAGKSTYTLKGGGELHVVDANIYELPQLVSLLKVLRVRAPNTTAFNSCEMQFEIHGEDVFFRQLDLLGDVVSLYGRGQANFDRQLNLVFYTLVGPGRLPIPVLNTVLSQISEQSLQLKVTGPLENPIVAREALPEVNKILQQIRSKAEEGASAVTAPAAAAVPWAPLQR